MSTDKLKFFPLPLKGVYVGGGRWKLTAPFEYHSEKYGIIKVPSFLISDGASIPKPFYSLIGGRWTGKYVEASIIHDFLYFKQIYSRRKSDLIFLEAMKVLKVSRWKRKVMYYAVRGGAYFIWKRRVKQLKAKREATN